MGRKNERRQYSGKSLAETKWLDKIKEPSRCDPDGPRSGGADTASRKHHIMRPAHLQDCSKPNLGFYRQSVRYSDAVKEGSSPQRPFEPGGKAERTAEDILEETCKHYARNLRACCAHDIPTVMLTTPGRGANPDGWRNRQTVNCSADTRPTLGKYNQRATLAYHLSVESV